MIFSSVASKIIDVRKKARVWIGAPFTTAMQNDWLELGLKMCIFDLFSLIDWHKNHISCINCLLSRWLSAKTLCCAGWHIKHWKVPFSQHNRYILHTGFYTCIMYCQWRQIQVFGCSTQRLQPLTPYLYYSWCHICNRFWMQFNTLIRF